MLKNLTKIPKRSATGVDGQTVEAAKQSFEGWIEPMLQSIHRQGYRAPNIRRVYIPKPGKMEKRPLGVPTVADRALQRTTAEVLSAIYERDFLPCSFGGRPELSAHHALATLNEVIAGGMTGWVLEADLKNFFGSLNHDWVLRFVEHRVGDPRADVTDNKCSWPHFGASSKLQGVIIGQQVSQQGYGGVEVLHPHLLARILWLIRDRDRIYGSVVRRRLPSGTGLPRQLCLGRRASPNG